MGRGGTDILNKYLHLWFNLIEQVKNTYCLLFLPYRNKLVVKSIASNHPNAHIRKKAFESLGVTVGEGTHFNPGIRIVNDYPDKDLLIIGKNVAIAPGVIFICNSSPNRSDLKDSNLYVKDRLIKTERIIVEDDVWLGAGAIILPGVQIGKGAIIGAGAVVISDVPEYTIAAGVPSRQIRSIKEYNIERGDN